MSEPTGVAALFSELKAGDEFHLIGHDWLVKRDDGFSLDLGELQVFDSGSDTSVAVAADLFARVISPLLQITCQLELEYAGARDSNDQPLSGFEKDWYHNGSSHNLPNELKYLVFRVRKAAS
jgi:hypothetical protein